MPMSIVIIYYFLYQFRYSTTWELTVTIVGALLGALGGFSMCITTLQFGEMMTTFVERSVDNGQISSYLPMTTFFGGGRRL